MRVDRKLILLLAGDAVLFGNILPRHSHVIVVINIPEPVVDHGVHDLCIADTIALARLRKQIRRVGHRFHSARDNDGAVPGLDRLGCEPHSFEP